MKQMVVFVSSTFRDMVEERNQLLHGAFRQLEFEAGLKGIQFKNIDLRWGITSASSEVETIRRCLDLVGECKPYFLALIGGRYGWVPPKTHLQSLTPPFRERPPDGTGVTELEILRFFESPDSEPDGPKGLFFLLNDPQFETSLDQERIIRLRSKIQAEAPTGRAEIHHYGTDESGLAKLDEQVLGFFRARISDLAKDDPPSGFPASTLTPVPEEVIQAWPEHATAMSALAKGRIIAVDSAESTLRTAFINRLARDYLQASDLGDKATFLHLGAKGILSGEALKRALEDKLESHGDIRKSDLVALDAMESLADWIKSGDVDTLATSQVMARIWEYADSGICLILGGDWSARATWLEILPNLEVIRLDRTLLQSTDEVIEYFKSNFAKELTGPQADAICHISEDGGLNDFEQILLCDRIRRYGDLKPEGVTQDEFLLDRIQHSMLDSTNNLVSGVLSDLASAADEARIHVITDAISVICISRQGVSLFDLQEMADKEMAISSEEWALMRGHLGPLLMGTIGRIRCIDERAREQIAYWLGEDAVTNGRRKLRHAIFKRSIAAESLSDLLDPARVMSIDLRWLMSDITERDRGMFLWQVLNPALWLSLGYHDWLLASRLIEEIFETDITADFQVVADLDPWKELDHLGRLVGAAGGWSVIAKSRLDYALGMAELITNGPEQNCAGTLRARVLACGIAQRRGIVISRHEVCRTTLGWSLDWALELSRSDHQHLYAASTGERAWVEFALLFALWLETGVVDMSWIGHLAERIRGETPSNEVTVILREIRDIPRQDIGRTPPERKIGWQSRLREWIRPRKDIPSNHSELMELFHKL